MSQVSQKELDDALLKYTEETSSHAHQQLAKFIQDHFDDYLNVYFNIKPKQLYRGYTFKKTQLSLFKKIFNDSLDGSIKLNSVTSWTSSKRVATEFFAGVKMHGKYSLLLITSVPTDFCLDLSRFDEYDMSESEYILPPTTAKVYLVAAYSRQHNLVYYDRSHAIFTSLIYFEKYFSKFNVTSNIQEFVDVVEHTN